MANKKVSQLSATTEANDKVWIVMNNSGETETFKIKREDFLSGTTTPPGFIQGDASQSLVPYYFPTSAATAVNTTYVDRFKVVSGIAEISKGTNTLSSSSHKERLAIGSNNTLGNPAISHLVVGGNNNLSSGAIVQQGGFLVIGDSNSVSSNICMNGAIFGNSNQTTAGWSLRFGNNGAVRALGGVSAGEAAIIDTGANWSMIYGDNSTTKTPFSITFGANNSITSIGGKNNAILAGHNNSIIGSNSFYDAIIGGTGNTINAKTNVVMLGTNNLSATTSNTTYVDNIEVISKVILADYTNLDYADDAAADAGGIPLGGIYHTSGAVKVRIT